ncbi:peptide ligase PGM1-related protein [Paenibacillus apiarius]|uniref:peptide ligase PGM1-related protein n=1 Tax=Paenibacillus apiarius TaxID=46240 RepID=UPI001980382E|nr:peptide ligase PGM1-related protein [Paenibacillus apiarius]MBN3525227.1 hypothetical protein [Paenibacillus apiarius]
MRNPLPEAAGVSPAPKPLYDGPRIALGTFDAEAYWRPAELAALPAIRAAQRHSAAGFMDELLFPLSGEGGVLVTRHAMNEAHKAYLRDIGFRFRSLSIGKTASRGADRRDDIFQAIAGHPAQAEWRNLLRELPCAPYAVIPSAAELARRYNLAGMIPAADVVAKVNSKAYSLRLAEELELKPQGRLAVDAAEVERIGTELLRQSGRLVMKDPYGVSGSGNLAVDSSALLGRLASYLRVQQKAGKRVMLLLEPWLAKQADFSCQLFIAADGRITLLGVQRMVNRQLNYAGSRAAEAELTERLAEAGYFAAMERLAVRLYQEGYFGPVCVDSMLLENGDVYPVVEINARHSMGMLNHCLDTHFEGDGRQSFLTCLQLGLPEWALHRAERAEPVIASGSADIVRTAAAEMFARLLDQLDQAGLLFKPEHRTGIVPLSANTLFTPTGGNTSGRWYVSLVADSLRESEALSKQLHHMLSELGFRLY